MGLNNTFLLKIKFESNNNFIKQKYSGHVIYSFINGKLNDQKWFVEHADIDPITNNNMIGKTFGSISKIVSQYRNSAITGAYKNKDRAAVVKMYGNGIMEGYSFYSLMPAKAGNQELLITRVNKKDNTIDFTGSTIELEKAIRIIPELKEKLEKYNGVNL